MRRMLLPIAVVALLGVGGYFFVARGPDEPRYRLAPVDRGDIVMQISASGTVRSPGTVPVVAQVTGVVRQVLAGFNTMVKAGDPMAEIDGQQIESRRQLVQADLEVAQSNVGIAEGQVRRAKAELVTSEASAAGAHADVEHSQLMVGDSEGGLGRTKGLTATGDPARARLGHAQTVADSAKASGADAAVKAAQTALDVAKAQLANAKAVVAARQAALAQVQQELDHTVIRAPVGGVVIERNVTVGQVVGSGAQNSVLFTISKDPHEIEVEANVDEADIGRVSPGQAAHFTFASFPGRVFNGQVKEIHRAPQVLQNVVTYTVVISAENQTLELLPGMTADVRITVARHANVLRLPNAALRFRPASSDNGMSTADTAEFAKASLVWRPDPRGHPKPVEVHTGISDGRYTEISGSRLKLGDQVIVGLRPKAKASRSFGPLRL